MTTRDSIPDSTIIAAWWWPKSRADIACMLHINADHVKRVWAKAKEEKVLPRIARPAKGIDLRKTALEFGCAQDRKGYGLPIEHRKVTERRVA